MNDINSMLKEIWTVLPNVKSEQVNENWNESHKICMNMYMEMLINTHPGSKYPSKTHINTHKTYQIIQMFKQLKM